MKGPLYPSYESQRGQKRAQKKKKKKADLLLPLVVKRKRTERSAD